MNKHAKTAKLLKQYLGSNIHKGVSTELKREARRYDNHRIKIQKGRG